MNLFVSKTREVACLRFSFVIISFEIRRDKIEFPLFKFFPLITNLDNATIGLAYV